MIAAKQNVSIDIVNNVECCMIWPMDSTAIVAALDALAHEHRLKVFRMLVQAGPEGLTAGALSSGLEVKPSALSFHLKDLVRADLIQPRHVGRQTGQSATLPAWTIAQRLTGPRKMHRIPVPFANRGLGGFPVRAGKRHRTTSRMTLSG